MHERSTTHLAALTTDQLRNAAPAIFADTAHSRTSHAYTFIPTERVLHALAQTGFYPVTARQTSTRANSPLHARHMIRLRRRFETLDLRDTVPEILLLNSHDATTAYQLRVGLYRVVCTNGLIVSAATFPTVRITHRGNIIENIVTAALQLGERLTVLAASVDRMRRTHLDDKQRLDLAAAALTLRFPNDTHHAMPPSRLLEPRRPQDVGNDLWRTFNVVQENVLRGGLVRRTASNRLTRTRAITSIPEDIRLNTALWDLAISRAA